MKVYEETLIEKIQRFRDTIDDVTQNHPIAGSVLTSGALNLVGAASNVNLHPATYLLAAAPFIYKYYNSPESIRRAIYRNELKLADAKKKRDKLRVKLLSDKIKSLQAKLEYIESTKQR